MTTTEPGTPHDDGPREHRRLGKRILDAVLGDPAETGSDDPADTRPADTRRADPDRVDDRAGAEGFAGDGPRGEYSSYEPAAGDRSAGGAVQDDRAAAQGYLAPTPEPGDMPSDAVPGVGQAGYTDRNDAVRDTGYDARDTGSDARRDTGQAGRVDRNDAVRDAGYDARQDAGQGGYADRSDAGAAAYDDRRDAAQPGYADQDAAGRLDTAAAPRGAGYDEAGSRAGTAPDAAHDLPRPGAGLAGEDRDLVTSSYDPDRDTGYDPQAAGTAMDSAAGARAPEAPDRDTDYDTARDTGYVDDPRRGGARDYDSAQDTGYVDPARAEADRTTGRRDDDFDTGRVDTGRVDSDRSDVDRDRVPTEPVERDDTHRGTGAALGAAGAGAVAAAAVRRDRSDADRDVVRDSDRDARFSAVDDTATVDSTDTGRRTAEATAPGGGEAGVADEDGDGGTRERLVPDERAQDYSSRWDALKGDFVDEPRRAVRQADELVGELLDELQRLFADQRRNLEQGFDHDRASTEDLRLALRRYRSFFDRLLTF